MWGQVSGFIATDFVEAWLSLQYVCRHKGYIKQGSTLYWCPFSKMDNKTFLRNVNILRNMTHNHQHVHLHRVDMDHLVVIIIGYFLLGLCLLAIGGLVIYGIKQRWTLMARIRQGANNMVLYL